MSETFTTILRQAIVRCGLTRYEIAKRSGVSQATLSRFVAGGSLKLESVDRLIDVLGLEVRPKSKRKRGK
jgi:transcriptional regulator with XRE-family HTH domain